MTSKTYDDTIKTKQTGTDTQIEWQAGEAGADFMGRASVPFQRVKLYYSKGRGAVLSFQYFKREGGFESTNIMGDGNTLAIIEPMKRIKPKQMKALGAAMIEQAELIRTGMGDDWHDDEARTKEDRSLSIKGVALLIQTGAMANA